MSDNWKPGDVALVNGHVAFVWADEMFVYTDADGDAVSTWLVGSDARRLVVIDPEDREQVERLAKAMHESDHIAPWHDLHNETRAQMEDAMQAALREFASPTPPKPEEPLGLGAVVEDAEGDHYVRRSDDCLPVWVHAEGKTFPRHWENFTAVRVLSEGVTP